MSDNWLGTYKRLLASLGLMATLSANASASPNDVCVREANGVVHITSGGSEREGRCSQKTAQVTRGQVPEQPIEHRLLDDDLPIRKFAAASNKRFLEGSFSRFLSGPQDALTQIWSGLRTRAEEPNTSPFIVVQYGDSHSQGGFFSDSMRRRLAVPPVSPGLISSGFPLNWGASVLKKGEWKRRNWLRDDGGRFGPLGIVFTSKHVGDELIVRLPESDSDGAERTVLLTVLFDNTDGKAPFEMRQNDQPLLPTETLERVKHGQGDQESGQTSNLGMIHYRISNPVGHLALVTLSGTSENHPVSIFGFSVSYDDSRLIWDNLGVSGTEIKHLLFKGDSSVESYLKWRQPNLFLLWFGTNALNDPKLSGSEYRKRLRSLLDRIAAVTPQSACLIVGPPDFMKRPQSCFLSSAQLRALKGRRTGPKRRLLNRNLRDRVCNPSRLVNHRKRGRFRFPVPNVRTMHDWDKHAKECRFQTVALMDEMVAIQREVAHEAGCLYFDTFGYMGGAGSILDWACKAADAEASLDLIHLNKRGYRRLGDAVIDALNNALEKMP